MITLPAFISLYLGVPHTGDNSADRGQCVGLIELWLAANKQPAIWANAVDILAKADPKHYTVTENSPTNAPPTGAVVCWNGTWGNGYGHTAVVIASNGLYLAVFEQNDPLGSAPVVATHGYSGVQGWITWRS